MPYRMLFYSPKTTGFISTRILIWVLSFEKATLLYLDISC